MKTISKFFTVITLGWAVASCNNAPTETVETKEAEEVNTTGEASATYVMVTNGDEISWEGFKTFSDSKHIGTMQVQTGEVTVENGEVTGGSFVIDMNSIQNEDLPEDGDFNQDRLVGHLKSEDFFHTEKYPTATFTITGVTPAENTEGATHMISGNLNMRGKEKNITFPATVDINDNTVSISTPQFVIDRTEWEVMYNSKNLGSVAKDNLIDNNIRLKVDVKAEKA